MSKRRSAATRRAELRGRRADGAEDRPEWRQNLFGISVVSIAPGGGRKRDQVRWTIPDDPFEALMGATHLRSELLATVELECVQECRSLGVAWESIGYALAITGEAARLRYRHQVEH